MLHVALINGPLPDGALFMREGRCTQRSSIWATQWPPISLAYLAAVVRDAGARPFVFDCPPAGITMSRLAAALRALAVDWCFLAVSTPTAQDDLRLAAEIKRRLPAVKIGAFGVHPTVLDREILDAAPAVDCVVRGEPEETVRELLAREPAAVAGVTWRDGATARRNPDRPAIADLDRLPWPAWDALDTGLYRLPFSRRRFLCAGPSRGCAFGCSFCTAGAYYGRRVRFRGPASLTAEIVRDRREFGVHDFFMWAETFTLNRAFVLELCRRLRQDAPGIRWTGNSRVDSADEELFREMRAAGCWMISFGIESTDENVLAAMGKQITVPRIEAALRAARRAGLKTVGHFILGLPGDSPRTIAQTSAEARRFDLDFAQFYAAAPFVGSSLYAEASRRGLVSAADFPAVGQHRATLRLPGLPPAEVDRALRRAVRDFYGRPRQIGRVLHTVGWGIFRQIAHEIGKRLPFGV